jgi:hypothetical protein
MNSAVQVFHSHMLNVLQIRSVHHECCNFTAKGFMLAVTASSPINLVEHMFLLSHLTKSIMLGYASSRSLDSPQDMSPGVVDS